MAENKISPDDRYTAEQVAGLVFDRKREWFYKHRRALRALDGFPKPISSIGQPRWNGQALIDWINRPQPDLVAGESPVNVTILADVLATRARAISAKQRFSASR